MSVRSILEAKGRTVVTVRPEISVIEAVRLMGEWRIGAVVVSRDGEVVDGILSERDIVRVIGESGAGALDGLVSGIMTRKVETCSEDDPVSSVMARMTAGRFRHLPVAVDGKLAGMISIGDVVKQRIEEIQSEADALRDFITTV